jgi:hypothetical protein
VAKIKAILEKRRVDVTFVGRHTDIPDDWDQQMAEACLQAKGAAGHFDLLTDFSQSSIMPQEVAVNSERTAKWLIENGMRKGASVVDGALQKMQVNRVTANSQFQAFEHREEAETWLDK